MMHSKIKKNLGTEGKLEAIDRLKYKHCSSTKNTSDMKFMFSDKVKELLRNKIIGSKESKVQSLFYSSSTLLNIKKMLGIIYM